MELSSEIKNYTLGRILGRGGFGIVYEGRSKLTGTPVAVKMIEKKKIRKSDENKIRGEISIQKKLKHPALVELYQFFEDENHVYLILELCALGDVHNLLKKRGKLCTESEASYIIRQLVHGLQFLHRNDILHRDLKPANILLTENMEVKIGDFGLSKILTKENSTNVTMCGTPNYIAPEVAVRKSNGPESDVWSVGIILYTLLVGHEPFNTSRFMSTLNNAITKNHQIPSHLSETAHDLIDKLLVKDPTKRIRLDNILIHPFIKDHNPNSSCFKDSGIASSLHDVTSPRSYISPSDKRQLSGTSNFSTTPLRCTNIVRNCSEPSPHYRHYNNKENCQCVVNDASCHCSLISNKPVNSLNLQFNNCSRIPMVQTNSCNQHSTHCHSQTPAICNDNIVFEQGQRQGNCPTVHRPRVPPLDTYRLAPTRDKNDVLGTIFTITESGELIAEYVSSKRKDKIYLCLKISNDGLKICVYDVKITASNKPPDKVLHPGNIGCQVYSYYDLPQVHWERYKRASWYVEKLKAKTMKITYYSERAWCVLMENSPDNNFLATFYTGEQVRISKKLCRITDGCGSSCVFDINDCTDLSTWTTSVWLHAKECHDHCLATEKALDAVNTSDRCSNFPCIIGKNPVLKEKSLTQSVSSTAEVQSTHYKVPYKNRVQTRAESTPLNSVRRKPT